MSTFLDGIQNRCKEADCWLKERGQGTIFEFDSGGCRRLSLSAQARARSGCGALYLVLGRGNWCILEGEFFEEGDVGHSFVG